MKNSEILEELEACDKAKQFVDKFNTPQEAWENCSRPSWMVWLIIRTSKDKNKSFLFLCDLLNKLIPNNEKIIKSTNAIKKFLSNKIDLNQLIKIGDELFDIDDAAYAAYAAYAAAHAAVADADADAAHAAAADAAAAAAVADADADAAYAVASADATDVATDAAVNAAVNAAAYTAIDICNMIRKTYPNVDALIKGTNYEKLRNLGRDWSL